MTDSNSAHGHKRAVLRELPSVDALLKTQEARSWLENYPRPTVINAVRQSIAQKREAILKAGLSGNPVTADVLIGDILETTESLIAEKASYNLRPVINATGIIIHTNLGRAPLCQSAIENITAIGHGYSNLEYDLKQGRRGKRFAHVKDTIVELTGSEDAFVVNNNAAAVLVSLMTLARTKEVIVSRGELVEIGGSFRIPDIMALSGATLIEVGTTNKTHLYDYERALNENTAMILKVHQSNFKVSGFTESVEVGGLARLAGSVNIPLMVDAGSGCLIDLKPLGIHTEPTVGEIIAAGAHLVTFSGDKLLGGPQCGIIAGQSRYVEPIRKHPLSRAVRIDKFTLSAIEATLREYIDGQRAKQTVPVMSMLFQAPNTVKARALRLKRALNSKKPECEITLAEDTCQAGGGSLPDTDLPTYVLTLTPHKVTTSELERRLRATTPPIIARIKDNKVIIDLKTVRDDDLPLLTKGLAQTLFT